MRRKKGIFLVLSILLILVLASVVFNLTRYPLKCDLDSLINMDRKEIVSLSIFHYGQQLTVDAPDEIAQILDCFDTELTRDRNTYFYHYTGGDWGITFTDADGKHASITVFDDSGDDELKYRYYYYRFIADFDFIYKLWEERVG